MIPILYPDGENAFDTNGIGVLSDIISAKVEQELNGKFELVMKYPDTGIHIESLVNRCIILAKPDPVTRAQPFRVYRMNGDHKGTVTIYAKHIAYDLQGITTSPFSAKSVALALQGMKNNAVTTCSFDFWTDKSTMANMTVVVPNSIWKLLGGSEGSVLDTYRGEYEFDRFMVKLYERRGADRGVSIRYGKNLSSLEQDANCSSCYTGVYPFWCSPDGDLVQLTEKIVTAPGEYGYTRIMPLDLSQEFEEPPSEGRLRARAERYVNENDIGIPNVSMKVTFVQLEQTEEYKGTALLERVLLGDTVSVEFPRMRVSASARAVKIDFDPILERYNSVTLGRVKTNLAYTIATQQRELEKKPSESTVHAISKQLTAAILGAKGGAVRLLDTDGDGMPDTLYIADNPNPAQAVKVWRWNYEGWGASKTGYNGPFALGATLEDGILAEAVTAAKLVAGTVQSADGKTFFLDLDNGILRMSSDGTTIDGLPVVTPVDIDNARDDLITTLETYRSSLEIAQEQIRTAVAAAEEVTTEQGLTISRMQSLVEQTAQALETTFTQVAQRQDLTDGALASYKEEIGTFIRNSINGIEIGDLSGAEMLHLAPGRLEFMVNGSVAAYLSNNRLYVEDITVNNDINMGGHWQVTRQNGYGIRWIGG